MVKYTLTREFDLLSIRADGIALCFVLSNTESLINSILSIAKGIRCRNLHLVPPQGNSTSFRYLGYLRHSPILPMGLIPSRDPNPCHTPQSEGS